MGHGERHHLLDLCRAAMPGVAGIILSTLSGRVLAHEEDRIPDPHPLAARAARTREADTSAMVQHEGDLYLVVFVPSPHSTATLSA